MIAGRRAGTALGLLIILQFVCGVFFITDALSDAGELSFAQFLASHIWVEVMLSLALLCAIGLELMFMRTLLNQQNHLRAQLNVAQSAMNDIVEKMFDDWSLSNAERDVGMLMVKGMSITEIAEIRGNAEGTIKAHLNAIYRKSGTRNRSEVLSVLVDAVMGQDSAGTRDIER